MKVSKSWAWEEAADQDEAEEANEGKVTEAFVAAGEGGSSGGLGRSSIDNGSDTLAGEGIQPRPAAPVRVALSPCSGRSRAPSRSRLREGGTDGGVEDRGGRGVARRGVEVHARGAAVVPPRCLELDEGDGGARAGRAGGTGLELEGDDEAVEGEGKVCTSDEGQEEEAVEGREGGRRLITLRAGSGKQRNRTIVWREVSHGILPLQQDEHPKGLPQVRRRRKRRGGEWRRRRVVVMVLDVI
eukprot:753338-Hanusia_phi.AAC.1